MKTSELPLIRSTDQSAIVASQFTPRKPLSRSSISDHWCNTPAAIGTLHKDYDQLFLISHFDSLVSGEGAEFICAIFRGDYPRSRTSGEYRFGELMTPSSQDTESSGKPGRFIFSSW